LRVYFDCYLSSINFRQIYGSETNTYFKNVPLSPRYNLIKMLDSLFNTLIKRPLYSGIYTETWENLADGGITCFKELSVQYRAGVAVIMVTAIQKHVYSECS